MSLWLLVSLLISWIHLCTTCAPVLIQFNDHQTMVSKSFLDGACGVLVLVVSDCVGFDCNWSYGEELQCCVNEEGPSSILLRPFGPWFSHRNVTCRYVSSSGAVCGIFVLAIQEVHHGHSPSSSASPATTPNIAGGSSTPPRPSDPTISPSGTTTPSSGHTSILSVAPSVTPGDMPGDTPNENDNTSVIGGVVGGALLILFIIIFIIIICACFERKYRCVRGRRRLHDKPASHTASSGDRSASSGEGAPKGPENNGDSDSGEDIQEEEEENRWEGKSHQEDDRVQTTNFVIGQMNLHPIRTGGPQPRVDRLGGPLQSIAIDLVPPESHPPFNEQVDLV